MGLIRITNKADKTAEIDIEGYIGIDPRDFTEEKSVSKERIKQELKNIEALSVDTIIVNINSYGGDVNHGLSIHDLLAQNKAYIEVRINGMTASAATIITMAGNRIKMSDNALFLIHKASMVAIGNENEIEASLDDLKKVDERIVSIYAKRTGQRRDTIANLLEANNGNGEWWDAKEAKSKGFIDEIFEPMAMAAVARFDNTLLNRYGLPSVPIKENDMDFKKELRELKDWVTNTFSMKEKPETFEQQVNEKIKTLEEEIDKAVKEKEVSESEDAATKQAAQETKEELDKLAKENEELKNARTALENSKKELEASINDITGKYNEAIADKTKLNVAGDATVGEGIKVLTKEEKENKDLGKEVDNMGKHFKVK